MRRFERGLFWLLFAGTEFSLCALQTKPIFVYGYFFNGVLLGIVSILCFYGLGDTHD